MQTVDYTYGGKTLHLYFNGSAMFALEALNDEAQDGVPDILELAHQDTPQGHGALCRIAAILAREGELCRRYLQNTPQRIPEAEELLLLLTPMQMVLLRAAVYRAVRNGFGKGSQEDSGDIDTGLAELEKKTRL